MKFLTISLIILCSLSCSSNKKIYDLKKFCDYTIKVYKRNDLKSIENLYISYEEMLDIYIDIGQKDRVFELKQNTERFNKEYLIKQFEKPFSSSPSFRKTCIIDKYERLTPELENDYLIAEPIVTLKGVYEYNDLSRQNLSGEIRIKIGELIKTKNGWKIIRGPFLK